MEGFLNKQGDKGLVVNLWRKRWFQLDPKTQRMYYYKTKSKEELLGYINLAEATGIIVNDPKGSFSFTIQTRDRAWHLSASSEIDKQTWIAAIQELMRHSVTTHQPTPGRGVSFELSVSSPQNTQSRKTPEYLGIFEFEGEDGSPIEQPGDIPASTEETEESIAKRLAFLDDDDDDDDMADYNPPAPPNPTPKEDRSFLCGSLPVNVPRLASTWQPNATWAYTDSDDDTAVDGFEKPHEMAAKTYKEITLATGLDFDRPRSHSKRVNALI